MGMELKDAEGLLAHLENVGALLQEALTLSDIERLEVETFEKRHFLSDFCVRLKFQSSKYSIYSCG